MPDGRIDPGKGTARALAGEAYGKDEGYGKGSEKSGGYDKGAGYGKAEGYGKGKGSGGEGYGKGGGSGKAEGYGKAGGYGGGGESKGGGYGEAEESAERPAADKIEDAADKVSNVSEDEDDNASRGIGRPPVLDPRDLEDLE